MQSSCGPSDQGSAPSPFLERKAALAWLLRDTDAGILLNEHIAKDGATVFAHACELGAEGIVSKKVDGTTGPARCPCRKLKLEYIAGVARPRLATNARALFGTHHAEPANSSGFRRRLRQTRPSVSRKPGCRQRGHANRSDAAPICGTHWSKQKPTSDRRLTFSSRVQSTFALGSPDDPLGTNELFTPSKLDTLARTRTGATPRSRSRSVGRGFDFTTWLPVVGQVMG